MAIKVVNPNPKKLITGFSKAATTLYKDMLVKSNTGVDVVAAAHTGTTILGVTVQKQLTINSKVVIQPVLGEVLAINYYPSSTKQSLAVTDLGTQYDLIAASNVQYVDLDDTTGGFLILVGYDNTNKIGYFKLEAVDCLF